MVSLLFFNCTKESSKDDSFGTCDADGIFEDSLSTSKLLVGSWRWTKSDCGLCSPDSSPKEANKVVIASFNTDRTFSVTEDAVLLTEGTWQVEKFDSNNFYFSLDPRPPYLDGTIRVCATELLSDARAGDGAAYLFLRAD